jgi:outer membrane receptor protein involved in Fe transport
LKGEIVIRTLKAKTWGSIGLVLCALLVASTPAGAQSATGLIIGTVTDTSGAVIPKAEVTITHMETSRVAKVTTNDRGEYVSTPLGVGNYQVEAAMASFKRAVRRGITLEVQQTAVVNLVLEVGQVVESVEVVGDAPLLEPATSAVGKVVDNRRILELPLNTRNVYSLVTLTPGITGSIGQRFDGMNWSAYGTRRRTMEILVDGATATGPTVTGFTAVSVFPSVDAIQEFKVMGANVPAEYGRTLGTVLNVVFKSGSNDFHGSVYNFLRNSVFDANDFFANTRGDKLASFKRNQFGGVVSGPVRRGKTFFMGSYEGLRERRFASTTLTAPTLLQRQGDFSQTLVANGSLVRIFNPFTTRANPSGAGFIRDEFPGNRIPQQLFDPVAVNMLKYYPLPNQPGDPVTQTNNYSSSGSYSVNTDNYDVRVDHQLTDAQRVFARYSQRYLEDAPAILFPSDITIAEGRIVNEDRNRHVVAEHSYILSPRSVLTHRLGFSRALFPFDNQGKGFAPSSLGFPAWMDSASDFPLFPRVEATGYASLGNRDHRYNATNTYNLTSSLAQTRGSHMLKFGFDGRMFRSHTRELRSPSGEFRFNAGFTQGPDPLRASATAGNGLASLLLGTGVTGDRLFTQYKDTAAQSFYLSGYVQDDWRVTAKLTLNLGVRYDLDTPRTERYNRLNYFDRDVRSPLAGVVPGFPDLRGGLVYVGVDGNSRYQYDWDATNFSPRLGAAYQLTRRTVLRAGYAHVFASSFKSASGTDTAWGFRGETPWISTLDGVTPLNRLSNPYPGGLTPPVGSAAGLLSAVGEEFRPKYPDDKVPWAKQWNVTLQQELPAEVLLEIGYVGTRGRELAIESLPNQLDPRHMALGAQLNQLVSNPFFGTPGARGILAGPQVRRAQLLRPYPQYSEIVGARDTGGMSWYSGLQVTGKKRMSGGLQFEGSYSWSKTIDVGDESVQNFYDLIGERMIAATDIAHRFVMSYIYELPFGRGRPWGRDASGVADWLIGGWQINGITTFQSGLPLNITASNTAGIFTARTNANNNGQSGRLEGRAQDRLTRWFNTSVFSQPAPFTFGTASARIHDIRSHGVRNFDLSLFKEFQAVEKMKVQFRLEALNAFNTVQFGNPNTGVTSSSFGRVTSQANAPRQLQFGLKLLW